MNGNSYRSKSSHSVSSKLLPLIDGKRSSITKFPSLLHIPAQMSHHSVSEIWVYDPKIGMRHGENKKKFINCVRMDDSIPLFEKLSEKENRESQEIYFHLTDRNSMVS